MDNDLRKLLSPMMHVCVHCNQKIIGDIPAKIHAGECRTMAKKALKDKRKNKITEKKAIPAKELVRMMRGKLTK